MKHKIISAIGAISLTAATFGATAQQPVQQKGPTLTDVIGFCRDLGQLYLETNDSKVLADNINKVDPKYRQDVLTICMAYSAGFDDGRSYGGNASNDRT